MKKFLFCTTLLLVAFACRKMPNNENPSPQTDEIVSTVTVQLPLQLKPHTCVYPVNYIDRLNSNFWLYDTSVELSYETTRTDGKASRDYSDQINPLSGLLPGTKIGITNEHVSASGIVLDVTGGDFVRIDNYKSGKADTTVVSKASFSVKTKYTFTGDGSGWLAEEDKSLAPSCSYSNGKWTIDQLKAEEVEQVEHTLAATAGDTTTSLTVNQNGNIRITDNTIYPNFTGYRLFTQRDSWPNFEDYPVGCSPKWCKNEYNEYQALEDTKDLHPDGNRVVAFFFYPEYDIVRTAKFFSGVESNVVIEQEKNSPDLRGGIRITATASVKLKDGTTKNVEHVHEWIQSETGELGYYKGRGILTCFSVLLPVVENASEDFIWTFRFALTLTEDNTWHGIPLKKGNYSTFQWNFPEFKFKDCLSTVKDYEESKKISGIFDGSRTWAYDRADIIDGIEQN